MSDYVLLASEATGLHLCDEGPGQSFGLREHCDDACVWSWAEPGRRLENAATGAVVSVEPGGEPPPAPGSAEAAAPRPGGATVAKNLRLFFPPETRQPPTLRSSRDHQGHSDDDQIIASPLSTVPEAQT